MTSIYSSLFVLILVLFSAKSIFAESAVGNGAIGIVCYVNSDPKQGIAKVDLLEYAEGKYLYDSYQYKRLYNKPNAIHVALSRLAKVSPKRAHTMSALLERFPYEASMKSNQSFLNPNDTKSYINYANCEHKTIVLQIKTKIPGQPVYFVNQDLFDKLHPTQKWMTLLHEVLYREAISYGHTNSTLVRRLVALLFKDSWGKADESYIKFLYKTYSYPMDLNRR